MSKGQVLVLGSNATQIGLRGGGTATIGQYLNETAVPALALLDAGYDIVLATPNGAKPHIDAVSVSVDHFGGDETAFQRAKDFFASHPAMNDVRSLRSVVEGGLDGFVGVFVPGGHAPVVDLMQDHDAGSHPGNARSARRRCRARAHRPGRLPSHG